MLTDQVEAGPGGVMTVEVGVITGDLTVCTQDCGDGTARVLVQYTGADEWYEITGSPASFPPDGPTVLHHQVLAAIRVGGGAQL